MSWTVYVLIGSRNKPLYVGSTDNISRRLREHWNQPALYPELNWRTKREAVRRVELIECETQQQMEATEVLTIQRLKPLLNRKHNSRKRPLVGLATPPKIRERNGEILRRVLNACS